MAKEKKVVRADVDVENKNERYGRDKDGRIVKLETDEELQAKGKQYRIYACILWVLAILVEVVGILRLTGVISLFSNMSDMWFLIMIVVIDLLFFVPGSLLWKKANHCDPISEKNKAKFVMWNNLGSILSVLAFLPIIIFVLTNKNLDKKTKTVVTSVAAVALVIAGATGIDYNPVSQESLAQAQAEVAAISDVDWVYWAKSSKKYHITSECRAFSRSSQIIEGTVAKAFSEGLTEPCRICIPALEEDHDHTGD